MNPIAFSLLGFNIRWYGVIISCGIILGIIIAKYNCAAKDVSFDNFLDIILISLVAGIIGARLYYVIFNLEYYRNHLNEVFNVRLGGLGIHGGLIFGISAAAIYIKKKKLDFLKYADAAAPSIIIAQAIGRWGNFFNQEAHGNPVSYSFIKHFPLFIQKGMLINGNYYNPTFLYESAWNLCIFIILMILLRKIYRKGLVFFTYIGTYSIGRFFIEGMRTDSLMIGSFRIAQIVSFIGIILWIVFLFVSLKRLK